MSHVLLEIMTFNSGNIICKPERRGLPQGIVVMSHTQESLIFIS